MNRRLFSFLTVFALVLVGCGVEPAPTPPVEGVVLSYSLTAGTSYTYEVDIEATIDMTTTGDPEALGEEDMPGEMSLEMSGTAVFNYSVADGPSAGTYEITIEGDFTNVSYSGTVDGESVDSTEVPDLAELEPVELVIVVDEKGNLVAQNEGMEDFFGALGALEGLVGSPFDFSGFVGPPLTDEGVDVGDSWTETVTTPGFGDEEYSTEIVSTVTAKDTVDGAEVLVVDTVVTTDEIEVDLAEMMIGFFEGMVDVFGEESDEDLAEFRAALEQTRFVLNVASDPGHLKSWFDPEAGIARRMDASGSGQVVFDLAMPDMDTGELSSFGMDMKFTQKLSYRLIEG